MNDQNSNIDYRLLHTKLQETYKQELQDAQDVLVQVLEALDEAKQTGDFAGIKRVLASEVGKRAMKAAEMRLAEGWTPPKHD